MPIEDRYACDQRRRGTIVTDLIGLLQLGPPVTERTRRVASARRGQPSARRRPLDPIAERRSGGAVDPSRFAELLATDFERFHHGGEDAVVAVISLSEMVGIRARLGHRRVFDLVTEVAQLVCSTLSRHDVYDISEDGEIVILAGDRRLTDATERIETLCAAITDRRFGSRDERLRLTPLAGVTTLGRGSCPADVLRRARNANGVAVARAARRVEPVMAEHHPAPTMPKAPAGRSQDRQAERTLAKLAVLWERAPRSLHEPVGDANGEHAMVCVPAAAVDTNPVDPGEDCSPEVPMPRRTPGASLRRPTRRTDPGQHTQHPDVFAVPHDGTLDSSAAVGLDPGDLTREGSSDHRARVADGRR